MDYSLPHTIDEIKAEVMKQVEEDKCHHQAIIETTLIFEKPTKVKTDMIEAYMKCKNVTHAKRAFLKIFLK